MNPSSFRILYNFTVLCLSTNQAQDRTRGSDRFATCMIDEKLRMWGRRTQVSPGTAVLNIASCSVESIDSYLAATTLAAGYYERNFHQVKISLTKDDGSVKLVFCMRQEASNVTRIRGDQLNTYRVLLCVLLKATDLNVSTERIFSRQAE